MKNIYLLPTGESRLSLNRSYRDFNVGTEAGEPYWIYSDYKHFHSVTDSSVRPHHMYITNDEEIKEGDWCLYLGLSMTCFKLIEIDDYKLYWGSREYFNKNLCKKIILTTDPKLIEDKVQQIDDEFLEWFVKNPSCEEVEVRHLLKSIFDPKTNENHPVVQHRHFDLAKMICEYKYEIIIPKDEQKQHLIDMMESDEELGLYDESREIKLEDIFNDEKREGVKRVIHQHKVLKGLSLVNPAHLQMTNNGHGEFPDGYKLTEKGIQYIIEELSKE